MADVTKIVDDTRSFKLVGTAAQEYSGEGGQKKRQRRKKQDGGGDPVAEWAGSPDPSTWLKAPLTPVQPSIRPVIQVSTHLPMAPLPVPPVAHVAHVAHVEQAGGTVKHIKVELKKRVATHKVKLHPKKDEKLSKKKQSKKVRKITVGVKSLHKRMTRAKKVQRKVTEMPLEKLKELLISKKLIKANSKAPESILRQIAADSQLVANKIL